VSHPLAILKTQRLPAPTGIIHVGASTGQEFADYHAAKTPDVLYIEPIPAIFAQLVETIGDTPGHEACQALISDTDGRLTSFHITDNTLSSSMFPLGKHRVVFPTIHETGTLEIRTLTLDTLVRRYYRNPAYDLLVIDVQGAELHVLRGASLLLGNHINYVWAEVSEEALYEGGCTFDEVTAFLSRQGFALRHLAMNYRHYGDALYVRRSLTTIQKPPDSPAA
jgi:FkbM family methyltransferase